MPDFTTLEDIRNVRPNTAAEPPKCARCGENPGVKLAEGTLPGGQEAWFVPLCDECASKRTTPTATAEASEEGA